MAVSNFKQLPAAPPRAAVIGVEVSVCLHPLGDFFRRHFGSSFYARVPLALSIMHLFPLASSCGDDV